MPDDKSTTNKVGDVADDPKSDDLVEEIKGRAEAEERGETSKPGDPTPEDMQRLRESVKK